MTVTKEIKGIIVTVKTIDLPIARGVYPITVSYDIGGKEHGTMVNCHFSGIEKDDIIRWGEHAKLLFHLAKNDIEQTNDHE